MEDLKDHEEIWEQPIEEPSKFKKIFTIIAGSFLIFLMFSYVAMSYGMGDIIASLIDSETMEENRVKVDENMVLVFKGDSYKSLLETYLANEGQEFKACLVGELRKETYGITEIIIPEMSEQSFIHVRSEGCPDGTLVDLHSHPFRKCLESEQDLKTKELTLKTDPDRLFAILCEKDRFHFY
ncbi:MAG: hypothetical protein KKA79_08005 [Nanoarchaeota archaeon]|nr:hypothetical protein [Nanoarchaeota archaeon]MCG2717893.1 hypothetical protein [Nanoarchaeota archaeon]